MTPEQIVGELAHLRHLSCLSQREIAEMVGTWQSTVSDWENGALPSLPLLVRWAEALGYRLTLVPANQLQEVGIVSTELGSKYEPAAR